MRISAYRISNKWRIVAQRSGEVRAKNGSASSKKQFRFPDGPAGPRSQIFKCEDGFVAINQPTSRDKTSLFTGYDADTSETSSELTSDMAVSSSGSLPELHRAKSLEELPTGSIDSTQMGIYASIGNEKSYFDFAFTQSEIWITT